jgi:RimJ/RimL family protein N-acetyltransferase
MIDAADLAIGANNAITARWSRDGVRREVVEPTADEVRVYAGVLADWYNEPSNAALMGNTATMTVADVVEYWAGVRGRRARGFLLYADEQLVGDAELRGIDGRHAEFSIMIGARSLQGRGHGGSFAAIVHVVALRGLRLSRIYVQPKPENVRVLALERRLGYEPDDSPIAKGFADDDHAITMSIGAETFVDRNREAWSEVVISTRHG